MSSIYEHILTVPKSAIDGNGHVNNLQYLRWMLDAAEAHAESVGGVAMLEQTDLTWVIRSHHIEYLRPAFEGENLTVFTWIAGKNRAISKRKYKIVRNSDQHELTRGETEWVMIDENTGRPRLIPREIAALFETVPEDQEP